METVFAFSGQRFDELTFTQLAMGLSSNYQDNLRIENENSLKDPKAEGLFTDDSQKFASELDSGEQTLSHASSPRKHERSQRNEKLYACETCGHTFTQVSNLKRHERLHTGEKPHGCDRCDKTFSTISNLKQHQQIHENTENRAKFECLRCKKTYFYQSSLNKHLKGHDKKDAKAAVEKMSKSMSPKKSRFGIPKEVEINVDDSISSEEQYSDISPTIKKVKKEKAIIAHSTPKTLAETPSISYSSPEDNQKLEEEFLTQFKKSFSRILHQPDTNNETAMLKSILNLQYLSISDCQSGFPLSTIQNNNTLIREDVPYNNDNGLYTNDIMNTEQLYRPHYPITQHEGFCFDQPDKQAVSSFEGHRPILSYLENRPVYQKPTIGFDQYHQKTSFIYPENIPHNSSVAAIENAQSTMSNDMNQPKIEMDFLNQNNSQDPHDMINYGQDIFRNSTKRKISMESNLESFPVLDNWMPYELPRESSDSCNFIRDYAESIPFEYF